MKILLATPTNVDFSAITDALSNTFTASQVGAVIGTILASCVGIAVFWWGARKLVNAVVGAFKSGKIRF